MRRVSSSVATRIFPLLLFLMLSGCAKHEIRSRAVSYNGALSEFGNSQILLNAVRSAKRYPIYYSAIGDLTADETISGNVDTNFPFRRGSSGAIFLPNFTLSSRANISSGINNFKVGNLNNTEFQKRMFNEISLELFRAFIDNGWPQELIYTLMIQEINVSERLGARVYSAADEKCKQLSIEGMLSARDTRLLSLCALINETEQEAWARNCVEENPGDTYFNKANRPCSYIRFQNFYRRLRLLGGGRFKTDVVRGKKILSQKVTTVDYRKKIETKYAPTKSVKTYLSLKLPKETQRYNILYKNDPRVKPETGTFELRSAHKMIQYLGEIISAQLFLEDPFVPLLAVGKPRRFVRVPLLEIRSGPIGLVAGAIRTRHEGRTYYVPRPQYGSEGEARSLQAIAVINQIIAHQTSSDSLPKSQAISLIASN